MWSFFSVTDLGISNDFTLDIVFLNFILLVSARICVQIYVYIYGVRYRVIRRPRAYCPALSYCHTSQLPTVYSLELTHLLIKVPMDVCISPRIWLRKGFSIKAAGYSFYQPSAFSGAFFLFPKLWLFQHPCVYNLFLENCHLWLKNSSHYFIHWKHVRKYLQQICNSLLWTAFAFDYMCWLAIMHMHSFWCQTCNIFVKNGQIFV